MLVVISRVADFQQRIQMPSFLARILGRGDRGEQ
jgi:hypothetical protein